MKLLKKIANFAIHPKENYANLYFLKYHFYKTIQKIQNRKTGNNSSDMFNWSLYNLYYRGEIKEASKKYTVALKPNDYVFKDGALRQNKKDIKPLHPNHRILYETILQLNPQSVFEIGCGHGMHLNNLQLLLANVKLCGIDRSSEQIEFLRESYPELRANINVSDATIKFPDDWLDKVDVSFTQAVIMHIHTGKSHLTAISNLFNVSKKHVILMERWKNHNFMEDIKELQKNKLIKWENIYFYYKILEETGKPHLMICSKAPLNYPEITNYKILLNE